MRPLVLPMSAWVLTVSVRVNFCGWTCIHIYIYMHPDSIYCTYEFSFCMSRQWMSSQGNISAWQEMDLISQAFFLISSLCVFRKKL